MRPSRIKRVAGFAIVAAVVASMAACDVEGVGSTGVISLGPGVDKTAFATLVARSFADPSATFDPSQPVPGGVGPATEPLGLLTFPYPYSNRGAVNQTSDVRDWLLIAWLSHRAHDAPAADFRRLDPGDLYCTAPFANVECPFPGGSYCGTTPHVDCTITNVV